MKTGLTIQQMAQELLRQSKAKQDYLVNTGSLSLSVTSDAPELLAYNANYWFCAICGKLHLSVYAVASRI